MHRGCILRVIDVMTPRRSIAIHSSSFDILCNVAAMTAIRQISFQLKSFCHRFLQPLLSFRVRPAGCKKLYLMRLT